MGARRRTAGLAGIALALAVTGCAKGGGDSDSGAGGVDGAAGTVDAPAAGGPDAPAVGPPDAPVVAIDAPPPPDADLSPDGPPPPDAGPPADASTCPKAPCDLVLQCGCADPLVCDLDPAGAATGATACRTVTAAGTEMSTCTLTTDCSGGYICISDGLQSSCKEFCDSDDDCFLPGGRCVLQLNAGGVPIPGGKACTVDCNPTTAVGCPPGWGCNMYFIDPDSGALPEPDGDETSLTDCNTAGLGGDGDTCSSNRSCMPGFSCARIDATTQHCLRNCTRPTGAECTVPGETCFGFLVPARIGDVEYGVCFDPLA